MLNICFYDNFQIFKIIVDVVYALLSFEDNILFLFYKNDIVGIFLLSLAMLQLCVNLL